MVEIVTPENFVGKTLKELDLRKKYGYSVIGIKDVLRDTIDVNPSPDSKLPPDSLMLVVCKTEDFINGKIVNF